MRQKIKNIEIRLNDDGLLDEIVDGEYFHLEQMSDNHWWMRIGDVHVHLNSEHKMIVSYYIDLPINNKISTTAGKDDMPHF